MKRTVKFIPLLLAMFTASSCKLVYAKASTSAIGKSGVGGNEESLYSKSPRPYNGLDLFVPIDKSYQFRNALEDPIELPDGEDVDYGTAKDFVDNNYLAHLETDPLPEFTLTETRIEEAHIIENHEDNASAPRDIYIEWQGVRKARSESLWAYSRTVQKTTTYNFSGDESIHHVVGEHLCYFKGGTVYNVYTYCDYDESNEAVGTFYSYFNRDEGYSEKDAGPLFAINANDYVYFTGGLGVNAVDEKVMANFQESSLFYKAGDYYHLDRVTTLNYVRCQNGWLIVGAHDNCIYTKNDLKYIPESEESILDSVEYHQDHVVIASDCFAFTNDYETTSTSRATSGNVLRKETKCGRTSLAVTCGTFYPDLAEYAEADDPSGLIH